ncbi:thiamine-monophosphate kinase [Thalassobaculum fulvum]|uniref:Thiamine-monophosphate kinase n=1 Tax=Thalassobaculum fulvum TaxID=1633335 RepID=A0A918XR44_9PROT|nr:thiamine-phosphate kinase [Thalassobaculum fulvum]GHD47621.1 thiamine-monophosphate kinase [Thalassobaculum fulvum]
MGLGEFERIDRFFAPLSQGAGGAFGLTDDAALLPEAADGSAWVVTVDALVAGVHFLPDDPPDLVARKALRVNLSDLAAMGAVPYGYTLALALPKGLPDPESWLEGFARGLRADQDRYGIHLLGGDSVSTPGPVTLSITAFGSVARGGELRRSGASVGDDLWVSGTIGDAALGLGVLQGTLRVSAADAEILADRYRLPEPRVALGPALVGLATAGLDVSDGLVQDAGHIAERSGVALRIEAAAVPLSPAVRRCIDSSDPLRHDALSGVLTGGDDYELLFAAPPASRDRVSEAAAAAGVQVTRIGRVEDGRGVRVMAEDGRPLQGLERGGWNHF